MTFDAPQTPSDLLRRYYAEILHIVYRILFLLFAEQRGMLPQVGAPLEDLYRSQYSITALRTRAEGDIPREEGFTDLWEGLGVTFRMVREGAPQLGVFGYDGMLFEENAAGVGAGLAPAPGRPQGSPLHGRACPNSDLLQAIRALTLIEREGVLQRISYADLGVEELGSIYESLLDFTPRVSTAAEDVDDRPIPANTPSTSSGRRFFLDPRGAERKTTGSYYTHPSLVNELIKSALLPVARDRLARAGLLVVDEEAIGEATAGLLTDYAGLSEEQRAAGEAALLSIKVCDPAAGSGHFLVKANNTLGAELARIRSGDEYPTEDQVQAAKRDVLAHCIYAVDLNPMAVELCKVSLWINASVRDRPLSFLDHHIKCGNSLIGATPELMEGGIPTEAFQAVTGDHKPTVNAVRQRNREEQAGQLPLGLQVTLIETPEDLERWRRLALLAEEQPQAAREAYGRYTADPDYRRKKLEADFWTAAFFWPLPEGGHPDFAEGWAPTHGEFRRLQAEGPGALAPRLVEQIEEPAERYRFFHWHLEFPEVFADDGVGGFDMVLGNPPWERIKLQDREFFVGKDPIIAGARTAAERHRLIRKLRQTNLALYTLYTAAQRDSEAIGRFLRASGRFPLTSIGDINLYAAFAELARQIVAGTGRVGIVAPTGIATDFTTRDFFANLVKAGQLVSLYDFENREGLFPGTHRSYKFALLTLAGGRVLEAKFAFFLHTTEELSDPGRCFTLSREDLITLNPNTLTCPVFRTRHDAQLTRKIYRDCPVWVNEVKGVNPWEVTFLRMIDPFGGKWDLKAFKDIRPVYTGGGLYKHADGRLYLPVYEGKMVYQYDHRLANVVVNPRNPKRPAQPELTAEADKLDPHYFASPQHWVEESSVASALEEMQWKSRWILVQKKVTSPTNERTHIATIIPLSGTTESLHCILGLKTVDMSMICCLLANLNAFVFDFTARQKVGGENFNYFVLKQLPVLAPERYTPELLDRIVPRVVELTYTAWDLQPFAKDILGEVGPQKWTRWFANAPVHASKPPNIYPAPFVWDEDRRAHLRAELDALYARLYGVERGDLAYILDTFPIVRRRDEERWGEYRTKNLVLASYEAL